MVMEAPAPPARLWPEAGEEIETKLGAAGSSAADQLRGPPPVLLMLTCCELVPVARLKESEAGLVESTGGEDTLRVILTDRGLPVIAIPLLSTAASEIAPVYVPAASADDVTVMVKVAELLLAILAVAGVTASQPLPLPIVAVGVRVIFPEQAPITLMVKVCAAGL